MPQSWIYRWYFRIIREMVSNFSQINLAATNSPNKFSITNVTAVSTADVAMERSNMAPRAKPNINPYLMD